MAEHYAHVLHCALGERDICLAEAAAPSDSLFRAPCACLPDKHVSAWSLIPDCQLGCELGCSEAKNPTESLYVGQQLDSFTSVTCTVLLHFNKSL